MAREYVDCGEVDEGVLREGAAGPETGRDKVERAQDV